MKIYVMTDMEGCAGILNHDDWVTRDGQFYNQGLRLLTEEVNAAVDGLFKGGATEILVADGHGAGGINPEMLDERVKLQRGTDGPSWSYGLDDSFDGIAFVGQHAKAGTPRSHITHTQCFDYIDLAINDVSIGEYGQMALCAMELGVPTILACGENALAEEAQALTAGVVAVGVKQGLKPDGLEDLPRDEYGVAKLGAIHLSPKKARALIREGASKAVGRLKKDSSSFKYPELRPPYVRTARFRRHGDNPPWSARDEHPSSIIELMNMPFTRAD